MQRRARILLGGSAVALLASLALVFGLLAQGFRRQAVRRPNGEVLRLETVTWGAAHQWSPQTWWQRLLQPFFPQARWDRAYVARFYAPGVTAPYLVFWFTGPDARLYGARPQGYAFAVDE